MKMKITILEDSVIELERLKNGIRKYGQQYDWDIEIDEYKSGEEFFKKLRMHHYTGFSIFP